MTATSMGTRTTAASNSSEVDAEATTCKPGSLRIASASSWVWMRVLSATTILIKSAPCSSWDGIRFPRALVDRRASRKVQKGARSRINSLGEQKSGEKKNEKGCKKAPIKFLLRAPAYHQKLLSARNRLATYAR